MPQQDINLGTPGDNTTGDFVYEAFAKIQANFDDIYTNFLQKSGGTLTGNLSFSNGAYINQIDKIQFWDPIAMNNTMTPGMVSDNIFQLIPAGGLEYLEYNFTTDQWNIGAEMVLHTGNAMASLISFDPYLSLTSIDTQSAIEELKDELDSISFATTAAAISFDTYLTLTSANVQLVIEELKDEVDALALITSADQVTASPYLTLVSTDVQAMLEELKDELDVVDASIPTAGSELSFATYSSLTSANVQLAIEELKDEVDALSLSSGSGDMLKSTYDTGNNGIVDNAELLLGQNGAYYLSRANHTGTQLASTISNFDAEVTNNSTVVANTAKVTNATHTGEVTGSGLLTAQPTIISNRSLVTAASGDMLLLWDNSDSLLKRVNASDFIAGAGPTIDTVITDGSSNAVTNNAIHDALANINAFVNLNNIEANKIVDGAGSGLDADLLDGLQSTAFIRTTGGTMTGNLTVPNQAYSATLWDNNNTVPTKNAVRDAIEALSLGGGDVAWGDITGNLADQTDLFAALDARIARIGDNVLGDLTFLDGARAVFANPANQSATVYVGWETISGNPMIRVGGSGAGSSGELRIVGAGNYTRATFTSTGDIIATNHVLTTDDPYDATDWNNNFQVPTKNAIRDKIESLGAGGDFLRADVNDTKTGGNLTFQDNRRLIIGTNISQALQIYNTGANVINFSTTGNADIRILDDGIIRYTFDTSVGTLQSTGNMIAPNFQLGSDERYKSNMQPLVPEYFDAKWISFEDEAGNNRVGVGAQTLEQVRPEYVHTSAAGDKTVTYIDLLIEKVAWLEYKLNQLENASS